MTSPPFSTPKVGGNGGDSESPLDPKVWKSLREMAGAKASTVLTKIINNYLEDAPQLLQNIREAVAADDGEALRQSAHSLRSSSANLGAMTLSNLCKELEIMGREGNVTNAKVIIPQIESEYQNIKGFFQKVMLCKQIAEVT